MEAVDQKRATVLMGVPTMWVMMLNYEGREQYDISSLRFIGSAGDTLTWSLYRQFKENFRVKIFDWFGLTEARPLIGYYLPGPDKEPVPLSFGKVFPDVEAKIIETDGEEAGVGEIGELIVRGPCVTAGYYKDPEATADLIRNNWCYTGDLVKQDEEGYFYFIERKKDMIIRGGVNISPLEIEEVISEHGAVSEVAVIGIPDAVFGEQIMAFVVVKPGCSVTAGDLEVYCQKRLADYKIPRYFQFMESLPKGPTEKILKRVLKETVTSQ